MVFSDDTVKDSDFKNVGVGQAFPITITWTDRKAEWVSRCDPATGKYGPGEYVSGWPPRGTSKASGGGKEVAP